MQEKKCKDRIDDHFKRTVDNYQKAKDFFDTPKDQRATDTEFDGYGDFCEYVSRSGLSFDYVTPFTFKDQPEAYYRFQMSWGGPSDEFNIYTNASKNIKKIEYWFKDWWDGASLDCTNNNLVNDICSWFVEGALYPHEYLQKEQGEEYGSKRT